MDRARAAADRRARRAEVDDPEVVMEAAASFLGIRPRSVDETRRRLRHLGYRHVLVDHVIDRLVELGYLDDEAFARAWVESRDRARPRGESVLRRELALKGVDRDVIIGVLAGRKVSAGVGGGRGQAGEPDDAISDGTSPDVVAAGRLLERRRSTLLREPDPRKRRQKAYALLARNGFDPEICRDVSASFADVGADLGPGTDDDGATANA